MPYASSLSEHDFDLLHRPVDLVARDNQRRRDANGMDARVLGEDAACPQRIAVAARAAGLGLELDPDHEAPAAHLADHVAAHSPELVEEIGAVARGILDHPLF